MISGRWWQRSVALADEQHYNINADLDGDGEISLWDFGLLVEHFGMMGDD